MGRGIRVGLERCTVCGSATDAGRLCLSCGRAVKEGDVEALRARSLEFLAGRFGDFVKKDPELYAAAIERRVRGLVLT